MKLTLLEVDIQQVFLQLIENLLNGLYVCFCLILCVDKNVIKVHNNKNLKLFHWDLVDIIPKRRWGVGWAKRYYLILEVVIADSENHFYFLPSQILIR